MTPEEKQIARYRIAMRNLLQVIEELLIADEEKLIEGNKRIKE